MSSLSGIFPVQLSILRRGSRLQNLILFDFRGSSNGASKHTCVGHIKNWGELVSNNLVHLLGRGIFFYSSLSRTFGTITFKLIG